MSTTLVVGSIGFDIIFAIHGRIADEIILENNTISKLNMMFTAREKQEFFGGTGGNIAYGLGKLGEKPLLFSVAGKDFKYLYRKHLVNLGVDERVHIDPNGHTATFYGISDEDFQQIGIWQPNVYGELIETTPLLTTISEAELQAVKVAIFSAGTGKSIFNHMQEFRKHNKTALVIFDPGQVISIFYDRELLSQTLKLANVFIGNEVEVEQLQRLLGVGIIDVLDMGISYVIETKGEKGSAIYSTNGTLNISAADVQEVIETTGAGDAYRAGLIFALSKGKTLYEACKFGSETAAKSIGHMGPQSY